MCNRLVVKAQVTALSEAVGNLSKALARRNMWNNTVLVFMGDNGGPNDGAHSNTPLRGGKLNFFEGGIRPAAFVTSPLLPRAVWGSEYNGLVHEVDWFATFSVMAGVALDPGLDSVDVWPTLVDPGTPHRTEALVSNNILRQGRWKLLIGAGRGSTPQAWHTGMLKGCVLGTGGGWMVPPANASNTCPGDVYTHGGDRNQLGCPSDVPGKAQVAVTSAVDKWLCSVPCSLAHPCLFDVVADPGERNEVAGANPGAVARLLARLLDLQKNFSNATTIKDNGKFCDTLARRTVQGVGPFLGPWIDPDF